jgi:hypothetical protein
MSSRPFQFIIGCSRKSFTLHSALVAHHSAPLRVLMEGDMNEAKQGHAELDDVDEETFIWFCEYVYSGNYTPAPHSYVFNTCTPVCVEEELEKTVEPEEAVSVRTKKDKKKSKIHTFSLSTERACGTCGHVSEENCPREGLWKEFQSSFQQKPTHQGGARWNTNECEDYTEVFLCHARIYVFAHKYDIPKLCSLALFNLHDTLQAFHLHKERIADIVKLAQYCYDNEHTRDCEPGQDIDDLRRLVVHYIACKFEIIGKNESFLALMEGGGPFPRDLTGYLVKRYIVKPLQDYR